MAKIEISIDGKKYPPFYAGRIDDVLFTVISFLITMYISTSDFWEDFIRGKKLHGLINTIFCSIYPDEDD